MFDALVLRDDESGFRSSLEKLTLEDLPETGSLVVQISHSSVNYKDALAVLNQGKIVRASFPFVPGIDLVGTVQQSSSSLFSAGDHIVGTGGGLGENTWGGYSQVQRIPDDYIVRLPEGMAPFHSMAIGTAGVTAALSAMTLLQHGRTPNEGKIVVTGASGGVGSFAVLLLSRMGYEVVASTGKTEIRDYLIGLGASAVIDRKELASGAARPLDSARWCGAVDTVGAETLEAVISQMGLHGCIAACGNAGGYRIKTTVYPFILRGISLCGIDSNTCPVSEREKAWHLLDKHVLSEHIEAISTRISLASVKEASAQLLAGSVIGRLVVDLSG